MIFPVLRFQNDEVSDNSLEELIFKVS